MSEIPEGLYYTAEHEWIKVENDGTVTVAEEIELTNLVYYEILGGQVEQILAKPNEASLVIMMEAETDGEIMIKMNEFLIRPFDNDEYIALNHIKPGFFNEDTETHYLTDEFSYEKGKTITIPFSAGTEKIELFGSYVVPEFGHIVMIILVSGIIAMIIFSKKTNSITNLFYTKL